MYESSCAQITMAAMQPEHWVINSDFGSFISKVQPTLTYQM